MHTERLVATAVAAALTLASISWLSSGATARSAAGSPVSELDRMRAQASTGRADAQLELAMWLGDAHRRGASVSALVEAADWAERAWVTTDPVLPAAIARFVAEHCGAAAISLHWICSEGE